MFDYRNSTIQTITDFRMTPTMIARACGLPSQRVSDYTRKAALPSAMETRIDETVKDIARVWKAFKPFRVELDSPALLQDGLRIASQIENEREITEAHREVEQMLSVL
jgi:hypothetical protein